MKKRHWGNGHKFMLIITYNLINITYNYIIKTFLPGKQLLNKMYLIIYIAIQKIN